MATKAQYLTALGNKSYIEATGAAVLNTDESISEISYNVYDINVVERNDGEGTSVKHQFVVYDEGGGSEEVLTEYKPSFNENLTGYNLLITEIESISNIKSYWIRTFDTDQQYVIVRACIYVTDHIEIKWYLVYNDGGLTHEEISNPGDF